MTEANITTYLPKPQTSGNQAKGQFGRDAFRYIAEDDEYECPAGLRLVRHMTTQDRGREDTLLLDFNNVQDVQLSRLNVLRVFTAK